MSEFTLQEIECFEAVAAEGSFQAAALKLHKTHPAVHAAIKNLEARLGVSLLDRSAYRVELTDVGRAFRERAKGLLLETRSLKAFAKNLSRGEESDLHIVIGDLCPTDRVLKLLKRFFNDCPNTRLHLHFEALAGPWERLFDDEADLILHHVNKSDARLEWTDLLSVTLVPVVAPGFLPFPITTHITPHQMRGQVQCVIRDSAKQSKHDYFIVEGAHSWTVADQLMKKELIVQGMGWGHMPLHLVEQELKIGALLSIEGEHYKRSTIDIVVARVGNRSPGPIAERLWQFLQTSSIKD